MKTYLKQFGAKINQEELDRLMQSPNWKGNSFKNLEFTSMDFTLKGFPAFMKKQLTNNKIKAPEVKLPVEAFDLNKFNTNEDKFIWYGHSVLFLKLNGKTILIDPMFGENASPIAPFTTSRFSTNTLQLIDQFPEIDVVFMSHDHYDHLDFDSFKRLKGKVKRYIVPLGLQKHLMSWGIEKTKITELDWWDNFNLDDIKITFTPSRHMTGRGLSDRNKTLWGGYIFDTGNRKIYFSGDGGYGKHFKTIGEKLGPIDFAFVECGQYNKEWHQIHMYPEESVQAALDVNAKNAMPIHWAGFKLSVHPWKEPIDRFSKAIKQTNVALAHPKIGEIVLFENVNSPFQKWWENY